MNAMEGKANKLNLLMLDVVMEAFYVKIINFSIYKPLILVALSSNFPNVLSLGLEIRDKLVNYVGEKIRALRIENPGQVYSYIF